MQYGSSSTNHHLEEIREPNLHRACALYAQTFLRCKWVCGEPSRCVEIVCAFLVLLNIILTMEEKKRLTATKAAIAKFREEHPVFTDDYLASSVDNIYPNLYEDNFEVAMEIVKELYRRQEEWTDATFTALLREMTEGRKLVRFGIAERKHAKVIAKVNPFIERLYKEAQERTIYLSECPEYQDEDVKQYFEEVYSETASYVPLAVGSAP